MSFSNLVTLDKISLFMACLSGYERKIIHIDSLLHFRDCANFEFLNTLMTMLMLSHPLPQPPVSSARQ